MNKIVFEGLEYDPYFILDVTPDDSDRHIAQSFKKKVKRYHPDKTTNLEKKTRYKTYFQIIHLAYKHITANRNGYDVGRSKPYEDTPRLSSQTSPTDLGVGQGYPTQRVGSFEDYSRDTHQLKNINVNQFEHKKFNAEHFNKLFSYNNYLHKGDSATQPEISDKALIKSSDGFLAFNSLQLDSCANVSSYNGLMIASDNDNETGYWGMTYSDYAQTYTNHAVKNPTKKLVVPKEYVSKIPSVSTQKKKAGGIGPPKTLYELQLEQLQRKDKEDQQKVMKHITLFDPQMAKQALHGELEVSPSFLGVLKQHHEQKTIGN